MSTLSQNPEVPSILLATSDPLLRETRKVILRRFGFAVKAPAEQSATLRLIELERFDLLILGNSLPRPARHEIAVAFREKQRQARIIEIFSEPGEPPVSNPDAYVLGLDGPLALRSAVDAQLKRGLPSCSEK